MHENGINGKQGCQELFGAFKILGILNRENRLVVDCEVILFNFEIFHRGGVLVEHHENAVAVRDVKAATGDEPVSTISVEFVA